MLSLCAVYSVSVNQLLFEVVVPRHCPLARIDVKFRFVMDNDAPVFVTLYRALHGESSVSALGSLGNAAVASELNSVVVCGPVPLLAGVDASGSAGRIILTAPSLYSSTSPRSSTFYLHFTSALGSANEHNTDSASLGMDELSIAVFSWRACSPAVAMEHSRQREHLLHNKDLHSWLMKRIVTMEGENGQCAGEVQATSLDLLVWSAGMWASQPVR